MPSTCPCTWCPPSGSPARSAGSTLTRSPNGFTREIVLLPAGCDRVGELGSIKEVGNPVAQIQALAEQLVDDFDWRRKGSRTCRSFDGGGDELVGRRMGAHIDETFLIPADDGQIHHIRATIRPFVTKS